MISCIKKKEIFDKIELVIEDSGTTNIPSNYSIMRVNFLKYIDINGIETDNFNDLLKLENLNNIVYLEMFNSMSDNYEIYLKNSLVHNSIKWAWKVRGVEYYYINGVEYKYEDWLILPERVRESRDIKLKFV